jgi:pimeloyl-ACP methyl ester carboxylesterase
LLDLGPRFVDIEQVSIVHRRFGDEQPDAAPLVLLRHLVPGLPSWDPAVVERLAEDLKVVLLENGAVRGPAGIYPGPGELIEPAREALWLIDRLDLEEVDLLGFSLGAHVAQEVARQRPALVRRLVLTAVAPNGVADLNRWADDVFLLAFPDQPEKRRRPEGANQKRRRSLAHRLIVAPDRSDPRLGRSPRHA